MKKFFIFIVAGIVAVALFELFLRFSPFSYGISPVVYDKDIGMWHKKNFSSVWSKPCYHTPFYFDEKGLIKNNYTYNADKKDILIFGDSYMEALMVQNAHVMHNALYKAYQGKYNFLNYGLSETSAMQQLVMMEKKVDFSNVKTVVQFIRIESDIDDVDPHTFDDTTARPKVFLEFKDLEHYRLIPPKAEDLKEKFRDILGNFELYVFLKKGVYFIKEKLHPSVPVKEKAPKRDLSYNWLQMKGSLYQTKKFLAAKGVNYMVLLYGKDAALNQVLIEFLKAQNIRYHDILALAEKEGFSLEGFSCDSHWNDQTHQNVAKLIYKRGLIE